MLTPLQFVKNGALIGSSYTSVLTLLLRLRQGENTRLVLMLTISLRPSISGYEVSRCGP